MPRSKKVKSAAPTPSKRDASPRRDYEKENQRVAVLYFQGGPGSDDAKYVIPERALGLQDWEVFAYWSTLMNVHTSDKTKMPEELKKAEAECYSSIWAPPHDLTTVPPWQQFRDERRHIGCECPAEFFTISTFEAED
jgi:hypothetical protein